MTIKKVLNVKTQSGFHTEKKLRFDNYAYKVMSVHIL